MKNKPFTTIILTFFFTAIGIGAFIFFFDEEENQPSLETTTPPKEKIEFKKLSKLSVKTEPEPVLKEIASQKIKIKKDTPKEKKQKESKSEVPAQVLRIEENGLVEFEVKKGMAIAFGDVLLGKFEDKGKSKKKNARGLHKPKSSRTWPSAEIPYAIDKNLKHPGHVKAAVAFLKDNTPIRLVPFAGEQDAIVFTPGEEHCYSYLGRIGGHQPIFLSEECGPDEILHEIMHALGFIHEQSRTDRDEYIDVLWNNIDPKFHPQYAKVPDSLMDILRGTQFDYMSIMLYRPTAFAKAPGLRTMQSKKGDEILPIDQGLSEGDLERLRLIYGN